MGTYRPSGQKKKRSLADTLREAEQEHFLDCPNADFLQRLGALVLDLIFYTLILSAIKSLVGSLAALLPSVGNWTGHPEWGVASVTWLPVLTPILRLVGFYYFYLWPLRMYGGSPAKLLLGLRVVQIRSGETPTLGTVLLREIVGKPLSVVSVVGVLMVIFGREKRALHDVVFGTVVKRIHNT